MANAPSNLQDLSTPSLIIPVSSTLFNVINNSRQKIPVRRYAICCALLFRHQSNLNLRHTWLGDGYNPLHPLALWQYFLNRFHITLKSLSNEHKINEFRSFHQNSIPKKRTVRPKNSCQIMWDTKISLNLHLFYDERLRNRAIPHSASPSSAAHKTSATHVPVVQWIEYRIPVPTIRVRLPTGIPFLPFPIYTFKTKA